MKTCWVSLLVVAMVLGVAYSQAPPLPTPLTQFYDPNFVLSGFTSAGIGNTTSMFWYDEVYMAWKYSYSFEILQIISNDSILQPPSPAVVYSANGVCRPLLHMSNFSSFWSWLPESTYRGQVLVDNRLCDEWYLESNGQMFVYYGLSSNTSIPVRLISPFPAITSNNASNATMIFSSSLIPGPFADPEEVFYVADGCFTDGKLCDVPPDEQVVKFQAYVFHDPDDFSLINDNVADLEGDALFVCASLLRHEFSYFKLISWWELTFNTSYGQYALCNFGNCFGGNPYAVGREASASFAPNGGQCSTYPNNITGSWFSLQNVSICAQGQNIGDNGCTWQVVGRYKTINATCLFNHSFIEACITDFQSNRFPLYTANKLFLQAFENDYESENGCPPLVGPEEVLGMSDIQAAVASPKYPNKMQSLTREMLASFAKYK